MIALHVAGWRWRQNERHLGPVIVFPRKADVNARLTAQDEAREPALDRQPLPRWIGAVVQDVAWRILIEAVAWEAVLTVVRPACPFVRHDDTGLDGRWLDPLQVKLLEHLAHPSHLPPVGQVVTLVVRDAELRLVGVALVWCPVVLCLGVGVGETPGDQPLVASRQGRIHERVVVARLSLRIELR
jgi:hypothetical protein